MFGNKTVSEASRQVIEFACGEEYGDGMLVTDIAHDYVEPGYRLSSEDGLVVFGNWNPARFPRDGEPQLTKIERRPVQLANVLESIGADLEWLDEWTTCGECQRALRTQGNSYHWKMYGAWIDDVGYVCAECILKDLNSYLESEGWIDNPSFCLTFCDASKLIEEGWTQYEPSNPQQYEHGWHPGQTDDPNVITESIRSQHGESVHILFLLDESSQFYIRFSAWTKPID